MMVLCNLKLRGIFLKCILKILSLPTRSDLHKWAKYRRTCCPHHLWWENLVGTLKTSSENLKTIFPSLKTSKKMSDPTSLTVSTVKSIAGKPIKNAKTHPKRPHSKFDQTHLKLAENKLEEYKNFVYDHLVGVEFPIISSKYNSRPSHQNIIFNHLIRIEFLGKSPPATRFVLIFLLSTLFLCFITTFRYQKSGQSAMTYISPWIIYFQWSSQGLVLTVDKYDDNNFNDQFLHQIVRIRQTDSRTRTYFIFIFSSDQVHSFHLF